ncbi:MAG: Serine/threonine protein kinase/WD40 repeat protein [Acidobacteria bacterium]|nr:Serine/threonine protein kinase/WD40 repeat protein [Acidobacteriota bacterium]
MKICPTCWSCFEDATISCSQSGHDPIAYARAGSRVIDQKYRLDKLLGRGAMGAVYECTHIDLNRPRAIKLLVPEFANADPQGRLRLRREALTACIFDHPNLVRIYDFGTNVLNLEESGRLQTYDELYIVMELLRGPTLRDFLKQNRSLPLELCLLITNQIAEGLAAIHAQGVVFRDLKPANIMITFDHKGELLVKIFDFGAVKLLGQSPTLGDVELTGAMFVGSALYACPENCKAKPLDQRADIYTLGLILYEMIAGFRAFDSPDWLTLLTKHAYAAPPPLIGLPEGISGLVMRALNKDPNDRQQTAEEFLEELKVLASQFEKSDYALLAAERFADENADGEETIISENPQASGDDERTRVAGKYPGGTSRPANRPIIVSTQKAKLSTHPVLASLLVTVCLAASVVQNGSSRNVGKSGSIAGSAPSVSPQVIENNVEEEPRIIKEPGEVTARIDPITEFSSKSPKILTRLRVDTEAKESPRDTAVSKKRDRRPEKDRLSATALSREGSARREKDRLRDTDRSREKNLGRRKDRLKDAALSREKNSRWGKNHQRDAAFSNKRNFSRGRSHPRSTTALSRGKTSGKNPRLGIDRVARSRERSLSSTQRSWAKTVSSSVKGSSAGTRSSNDRVRRYVDRPNHEPGHRGTRN